MFSEPDILNKEIWKIYYQNKIKAQKNNLEFRSCFLSSLLFLFIFTHRIPLCYIIFLQSE